MITGDNPLTACRGALDCNILQNDKPVLIINSTNSCFKVSRKSPSRYQPTLSTLTKSAGHRWLRNSTGCEDIVRTILVLGSQNIRTHVSQQVVGLFKSKGITAMIGDGANDVEALENSHCGLAVFLISLHLIPVYPVL